MNESILLKTCLPVVVLMIGRVSRWCAKCVCAMNGMNVPVAGLAWPRSLLTVTGRVSRAGPPVTACYVRYVSVRGVGGGGEALTQGSGMSLFLLSSLISLSLL